MILGLFTAPKTNDAISTDLSSMRHVSRAVARVWFSRSRTAHWTVFGTVLSLPLLTFSDIESQFCNSSEEMSC